MLNLQQYAIDPTEISECKQNLNNQIFMSPTVAHRIFKSEISVAGNYTNLIIRIYLFPISKYFELICTRFSFLPFS